MVHLVRVATCNLNQWALDFPLNLHNIMSSITIARQQHARFRTGPELEVAGYGCEDHFYEHDTDLHCWQSIVALLSGDWTDGLLVDVGMPVVHKGVRYNCRLFLLNRRILLIRPKLFLANDGNYREARWFTPWHDSASLDTHHLPALVSAVCGQRTCPIGIAYLSLQDTSIGCETCEELFTPHSPHIDLTLSGVEIISNSSGSHHNLRKLQQRLELIGTASAKCGGAYLYANQQGCDGGRLYYDGCACIFSNGDLIAQSTQFDVRDVEVVSATIDLDDIRSLRASVASRSSQAAVSPPMHTITVDYCLSSPTPADYALYPPSRAMQPRLHSVEEEIAMGPACWCWDYLRRSGASGFFLPLSGGADSAASASIIGSMCHMVAQACEEGDAVTQRDVSRLLGLDAQPPAPTPQSPQPHPTAPATPRASSSSSSSSSASSRRSPSLLPANFPAEFSPAYLANRLLHTCYLSTANSSTLTRQHASELARDIGCYHLDVDIGSLVSAMTSLLNSVLKLSRPLSFRAHGGSNTENLALQNIQARMRMVTSYALSSLLPMARGGRGTLLVLGSANVDEALRGYLTKYDCSSADINPIGGISKGDLRRFLQYAAEHLRYPTLTAILESPPTAELEPATADYRQTDEADMSMSYDELGVYGRLRKIYRCGPVSMYEKCRDMWTGSGAGSRGLQARQVGQKVKDFFYYYAVNRHKLTVLTPAYHAENYACDDNRFDHRQFLYNTRWQRQFAEIDSRVDRDEKSEQPKQQDGIATAVQNGDEERKDGQLTAEMPDRETSKEGVGRK